MKWPPSRIKLDRAAGLSFDWRSRRGSVLRFLTSLIISSFLFGGLWAFVQIQEQAPPRLNDRQIDLTVVNLDLESNHWFSQLFEKESLYFDRWDVSSMGVVDREVARALAVTPVQLYDPTLEEILLPDQEMTLRNLPGMEPTVLPPPEPVALPEIRELPINWWIEVEVIEGEKTWEGFSFEWPGPKDRMSEGETWTLLVGVDWEGHVLTCTAWDEQSDPRTQLIKEYCFNTDFPALDQRGPLRWWKLQATVVNRLGS